MNLNLSEYLQEAYTTFDVPADVIVTDPDLREEFAGEIRMRANRADMDTDDLMRHLLRMRKAGKLPRLRQAG